MLLILQCLWLILPAALANAAPEFAAKIFPQWNSPLDFKQTFRGVRTFGSHKTIRGFLSGILVATLICKFQQLLFTAYPFFQKISLFNYQNRWWWIGPLIGFGALSGDAIKSFFKRQMHIKTGESWFPFDQLDWVIGTLLVLRIFVDYRLTIFFVSGTFGIVLHLLGKIVGYVVGLNRKVI